MRQITVLRTVKHVMGPDGECKLVAFFWDCKVAIPLKMEPTSPEVTDNSSAEGLINKNMIPKQAKNYNLSNLNRACFHSKRNLLKVYREKQGGCVAAPKQ